MCKDALQPVPFGVNTVSTPLASTREAPGDSRGPLAAHMPHDALVFLARRGLAEAQFRLGEMYLAGGAGLPRDPSASTRWFLRAAEQDHIAAQIHVAEAYYDGVGVDRDHEEAAHWFRTAANLGHDDAGLRLGMMYADAEANIYDDTEALERLQTAALDGYWPARHLLQALRAEEEDEEPDPFRHQRARDMAGYTSRWWLPDPNPPQSSPGRRWSFRELKAL